jgi:hypothetical protein
MRDFSETLRLAHQNFVGVWNGLTQRDILQKLAQEDISKMPVRERIKYLIGIAEFLGAVPNVGEDSRNPRGSKKGVVYISLVEDMHGNVKTQFWLTAAGMVALAKKNRLKIEVGGSTDKQYAGKYVVEVHLTTRYLGRHKHSAIGAADITDNIAATKAWEIATKVAVSDYLHLGIDFTAKQIKGEPLLPSARSKKKKNVVAKKTELVVEELAVPIGQRELELIPAEELSTEEGPFENKIDEAFTPEREFSPEQEASASLPVMEEASVNKGETASDVHLVPEPDFQTAVLMTPSQGTVKRVEGLMAPKALENPGAITDEQILKIYELASEADLRTDEAIVMACSSALGLNNPLESIINITSAQAGQILDLETSDLKNWLDFWQTTEVEENSLVPVETPEKKSVKEASGFEVGAF